MRVSKLSQYKEVFPFHCKPSGAPQKAAWFSATFKGSFVLLTQVRLSLDRPGLFLHPSADRLRPFLLDSFALEC